MDSFRGHTTDDINEKFESIDFYTHIILGGYTSILYSLDVGFNKPFKDYLKDEFLTFYNNYDKQ